LVSKYSIAVLPFVNMSSDKENEYFSDGISEEILNALSKINGLHVTARTSSFVFKNQNLDIREIGRRLNVSLLLEGSIRKSGNTIRITAQLTRAENGYHIWSETWDRELKNIFIVQDEIAAIIAEKINIDIKPNVPATDHVLESTEAFDNYLRGNYLLNTWDFKEGNTVIKYFEQAVKLDPRMIKAYIRLCDVYTWLGSTGFVKPEEAHKKNEYYINKVLELDPNIPDVYVVIASKNFWIEWNFSLALKNISRALELKPSFPDALKYRGIFLAAMGRVEEALDALFQADRLDPYADIINAGIGMIYNYTNENEKALEYVEKNIKVCPQWYAQYLTKIEALCKLKRYPEAWDTIMMQDKDPNSPLSIAQLKGYYYASMGNRKDTYEQLKIMEEELNRTPMFGLPDAAFFSQIYILLGEDDKALDYLEYGMENGATPFLFNQIDSLWDRLRNHPRYLKAIQRIEVSEENIKPIDDSRKYRKSSLSKEQANLFITKIEAQMISEKLWLDSTLNLTDLAEAIDIPTNKLSQVLNEYIGKNFYDYVNNYRLEYFLKLCQEPTSKKYTLLSLAYECGFNSKTTFNAFFKKTLNTTPSEYFKREKTFLAE